MLLQLFVGYLCIKLIPYAYIIVLLSSQTVEMSTLQERIRWLMDIASDNNLGQSLDTQFCVLCSLLHKEECMCTCDHAHKNRPAVTHFEIWPTTSMTKRIGENTFVECIGDHSVHP